MGVAVVARLRQIKVRRVAAVAGLELGSQTRPQMPIFGPLRWLSSNRPSFYGRDDVGANRDDTG